MFANKKKQRKFRIGSGGVILYITNTALSALHRSNSMITLTQLPMMNETWLHLGNTTKFCCETKVHQLNLIKY